VIKSFEKMRAIDSGLTDRENWLAEAQQALKLKEIQQMVELHRQEALGHFNTKEWGKALHALNSILKLDPGNERATRLRDKAQAEVAQAEAAALLAERYDNAKQAMGGEKWEDAVVLLKLVSQENAGYRDVASLLERASEQFADTQAELDVTLSVNPKEAKPDSQVTWTLTINNYSPAPIGNIVAREEDDRPLADPFALDPDESKEIAFTSELTTWAARRRRIRVEGTSPLGRPLQAEGKASVSSPPKKKVVKPQPPPPPEKKVVNPQPAPPEKKVVKQQPPPTEETGGYRDALRQAKETVDPLDHRTNHLIALFEKGEKHYRIARGLIRRPHDWDDQFSDWQDAVARLKPDEIVMVSLASATPDAILKEMATIAREIERRIGVAIPTQELRNL
ncbi:MAG: hypothetical protein ACREAB_15510, partial [Blastocatellia bacterium]